MEGKGSQNLWGFVGRDEFKRWVGVEVKGCPTGGEVGLGRAGPNNGGDWSDVQPTWPPEWDSMTQKT
jgi:hypothetical protein